MIVVMAKRHSPQPQQSYFRRMLGIGVAGFVEEITEESQGGGASACKLNL